MPVVDEGAVRSHSGLYQFLQEAEHAEYRRWEDRQRRWIHNSEPYPRQRRLHTFAAGMPVNVESGEVFGLGAVKAGVTPVPRPGGHRLPYRVIVSPDDTIAFDDDSWADLYVEEHGL